MICPYNNFKEMDNKKCATDMWVYNINYEYIQRCAIAYNGGVPRNNTKEENKE